MIPLLAPYKQQLQIAAYAAVAAVLFTAGYKVAQWRGDAALASAQSTWATAEKDRLADALKTQQKQLAGTRQVDTVYVQGAERVRIETKVVTQEVIRYVQNPAIERVVLPAEWVRLHDLAALGVSPASPAVSSADGAAQAVTDADAIAVVSDNYNDCRAYIEQVKGLQAHVREISR